MKKREGRRIKSGMPMDAVSPFIMATRVGAANSFSATIDIENIENLICNQRENGMEELGLIHVFMAAYVRLVSQLPGINRYIRGQRVYARNGIEICMVIKKQLKLNAPETIVKLETNPSASLSDVYNTLRDEIEKNKAEGDQNNMDFFIRYLMKLPRVLLRSTVSFFKLLDYFGLLPRFLTKLSPFHGSLFITNMGSLGMPPVFHHLYDFGNLPMFIAVGAKRSEYYIDKNGATQKRRVIDITIVCDDRICDGHYYASAFRKLKRILANPEQLLTPPERVIEDIK